MSAIFALVDPHTKHVFHVGSAVDPEKEINPPPAPVAKKLAELAPAAPVMVILQSAGVRPLTDWVKWSKRFRRDLVAKDWELYEDIAHEFTNSVRLKRALGEYVPSDAELQERFHDFDRQYPFVFDEMLRISRAKKLQGHKRYGIGAIVNEVRWGGPDAREGGGHKIGNDYSAFYSRKLQMTDVSLCGFFAVGEGVADDLVFEDGSSWRKFAKEHADEIRYTRRSDWDEEDRKWTY